MTALRFERVGYRESGASGVGGGFEPVDYHQAWTMQRELHQRVAAGDAPDTVLLLEHPPVYTAGRRTARYDRPADPSLPVVDVDRGGRITWHGPGQLVGYPIVKLADAIDVVAYVRRLEGALIGVCAEFGLAAVRVPDRTGVWLPADGERRARKLAAIGIRVARGVTMHGFGLNCDPDLTWFDHIVPCGIDDADVTSLSAELGRQVTVEQVLPLVQRHLLDADLPGTVHRRPAAADPVSADPMPADPMPADPMPVS